MIKIEEKAIEIYQNNLLYLQANDEELFNRVQGLSEMIELGVYQERYHLEYVSEDKSFDIYDSRTNKYLYEKKASLFDKDAVKNTNLDKMNSISLFAEGFYNEMKKHQYDGLNISTHEKAARIVANDIIDYTKVFNNSTLDPSKKFINLNKFYFIGTLLGTHIYRIHQKINARYYFICEYNLEIFRLSLFTCNYFEIAKKSSIDFSIMDDRFKFGEKLGEGYVKNFQDNYMIKYYCSNYNIHDYFERILNTTASFNPFKFQYPSMLHELLEKSIKNINHYNTLHTLKKYTILKNRKVLLLGAGPSLSKNLNWLEENQDKFFIVAIGATLKLLIINNIIPDLIVTADSADYVSKHFPQEVLERINNVPILASHMTHDIVLSKFNKNNVFLYEVSTMTKETSRFITGASVSESSFYIIYILGAVEIFFLGIDLALDQESGQSHIANHEYSKKYDIPNDSDNYNSFMKDGDYNTKETLVKVKGNFRNEVITSSVFERSITEFHKIMEMVYELEKSNIKVYNLSDGAYLSYTIPLSISELKLINVKSKTLSLLKILKEISSIGYSNSEIHYFKEGLHFIDKLLNEVNTLKKMKVKKYNDFINIRQKILKLIMVDALPFQRIYIHSIFRTYFQTIEPYLGYQFNDKKFDNSSYIKKVKKVWIEQIEKLCYKYKSVIESGLTKKELETEANIESFLSNLKNNYSELYEPVLEYLAKKSSIVKNDIFSNSKILEGELSQFKKDLSENDFILSRNTSDYLQDKVIFHDAFPYISQYSCSNQNLKLDSYSSYLLDRDEPFEERYALFYWLIAISRHKKYDFKEVIKSYKYLFQECKALIDNTITSIPRSKKRIYIYLNQYLSGKHAPSHISRVWASCFSNMGYNVIIVSCTPRPFPYSLEVNISYNKSDIEDGQFKLILPNVKLYEFSGTPVSNNRYLDFLHNQNINDQDRVLLVGNTCMHFDILDIKNKFIIPTISSGISSTASTLVLNKNLDLKNLNGEKMKFIEGLDNYETEQTFSFEPPSLNIQDEIQVVIVGNRLNLEIDDVFFQHLIKLCKYLPNININIVGEFTQNIPVELKNNITLSGFQDSLESFYKDMHFYLNPDRQGGGISAMKAIKVGLPVITLHNNDVSYVLKDKYSIDSLDEIDKFIVNYTSNEQFKMNIDNINKEIADGYKKLNEEIITVAKKILEI